MNAEASPEVVRAAYRALARKHHPDNGAEPDAERMVRINRAHEILSDPARRAAWDAEARRQRDAEAQRRRDAEAQPRRDAEARRRRDAEAQRRRDAEAQRQRDAEAQRHRTQAGPRPGGAQRQRAQTSPNPGDAQRQRTQARGQTPALGLGPRPWLVVVIFLTVFPIGRVVLRNADDIVQWIVAESGGARWVQNAFNDDGDDQNSTQDPGRLANPLGSASRSGQSAGPIILAVCSLKWSESRIPRDSCQLRGIINKESYDRIWIPMLAVDDQTLTAWVIDGGGVLRWPNVLGALQRLSPGVHTLQVSEWRKDQWTRWSTPFSFNVSEGDAPSS